MELDLIGKTCSTCRWWAGSDKQRAESVIDSVGHPNADCRIRSTPGAFPCRTGNEWCGEHRALESSINLESKQQLDAVAAKLGYALGEDVGALRHDGTIWLHKPDEKEAGRE